MSQRSPFQRIPILMYHSISAQASARFQSFAVAPERFAEQLAYLHAQAYTPLSVSQFVDLRAQGKAALPQRPVVLTFDDGFADFFEHALPLLRRYRFPATLYITTGYVNATSRWLAREGEAERPLLSWGQVREISASGIECGAHTHTHPQLDLLSLSQVEQELTHSKDLLEQKLGRPVSSLAYPYGYYTSQVRALAQCSGYTSACAVKFDMSTLTTDSFALARLKVSNTTSLSEFAALLEGRGTTALSTLYTNMRTPAWRLVRRYARR